jgi:surfeit locus 1 family protein
MNRLPILPTLIVGAAVAVMIALGIWQLERKGEKEALLAALTANPGKPAVAFPRPGTDAEALLFRPTGAFCLQPVAWMRIGGRGKAGDQGWRQIATCRTGAEGPGLIVDVGIATDPKTQARWAGGEVTGILAHAPDTAPMVQRLLGLAPPPGYMIVADRPAPGLQPSSPPSPDSIPNNHLAYAGQWFLFAAAAVIIYWLALRRRRAEPPAPPTP